MQEAVTILTSGALSTLLSASLIFLFRNWISDRLKASIQHEYDQKLETHKAQLRSQTETEIIRLKSQLQIAETERNVRYSKVFEHTAETIATTYTKLLALKGAADEYTQILEPSSTARIEAREVLAKRMNDFVDYFLPNKIYIPKETSKRIWELYCTLQRATMQYSMAMAVSKSPTREPETFGKLFDEFFKSSDEVPKLLELLHDEFQRHLGLSTVEQPNPN